MTFTESEGFATARQGTVDECKIGGAERSAVAEGKQTLTQHSGQWSASDLPSAQGDFKQVSKKSTVSLSHLFFFCWPHFPVLSLHHFVIASALCSVPITRR